MAQGGDMLNLLLHTTARRCLLSQPVMTIKQLQEVSEALDALLHLQGTIAFVSKSVLCPNQVSNLLRMCPSGLHHNVALKASALQSQHAAYRCCTCALHAQTTDFFDIGSDWTGICDHV